MGTYDTYGENIQIKAGGCVMKHHEIGDRCDLSDGVYLEYGGVIVVMDRTFVAEFPRVFDKWGGVLDCKKLIDEYNPVVQALKRMTVNTSEFWEVEHNYILNDFYWDTSGEIYNEEKANSIYDGLKNKYPTVKITHNTKTQEIIKIANSDKSKK